MVPMRQKTEHESAISTQRCSPPPPPAARSGLARGASASANAGSSGCGAEATKAALSTHRAARVRYWVARTSRVIISSSGTSAAASAKHTVFRPSHGPASAPRTLRVMIWQPVSSAAALAPTQNHAAYSGTGARANAAAATNSARSSCVPASAR